MCRNLAKERVNELRKKNECCERESRRQSDLASAIFDCDFGGSFDLV
jgi:hypothetical protein